MIGPLSWPHSGTGTELKSTDSIHLGSQACRTQTLVFKECSRSKTKREGIWALEPESAAQVLRECSKDTERRVENPREFSRGKAKGSMGRGWGHTHKI